VIDSRSYLPTLSTVVQSGIQTLIWAGDADWICNWFGGLASAEALTYSGSTAFKKKAVSNYTVNGATGGTFKTEGNLSWLRVFGAGHEVRAGPDGDMSGGRKLMCCLRRCHIISLHWPCRLSSRPCRRKQSRRHKSYPRSC